MRPSAPTASVRQRRLTALAAVLITLLTLASLNAGSGAGAAPSGGRPAAGGQPALNCKVRWLLHVLFDIGTPCPPRTTTTTRSTVTTTDTTNGTATSSTTTTTRQPPPTVVDGAVVYGIATVANCGSRWNIPCGPGAPASVLIEARAQNGVVASTRSDAAGAYRLVLPGDAPPVTIAITLEVARVAEQCTTVGYTPAPGGLLSADLLCYYAISYGTSVSQPGTSIPPTTSG